MNDERLRRLLSDAVSDIEPEDRLEELRAAVHPRFRAVPVVGSRPWYAAAAIVAAVIGVVAYVTSVTWNDPGTLVPSGGGGTHGPTMTATDTAAPSPSPGHSGRPLTVYYLGQGPRGDALFQEAEPGPGDADRLAGALAALMTDPADPDYRTAWPAGSLLSAALDHGIVRVKLGSMPARRPTGVSARTASETVQQAVYTLVGASGRPDARVQFLRRGHAAPTVLGVATAHPLARGPAYQVLSLMSISSPAEGQQIDRGPFWVSGTNNGPEATVVVTLVRSSPTGNQTVLRDAGIASGTGELDRLYPWRVRIDTSDLPTGTYTLVASNDTMASGGEGLPPATDTRTIVLR